MRLPLVLLLTALALPARAYAQGRQPLTPDQEAALYGIPAVATVGGALLLVNVAEEHPVQGLMLAMPLVAGATVCGSGRLTGAAGSCRGALVGGALGALPGLALIGAGYAVGAGDIGLHEDAALALVLIGAVAYVVVPPFTAVSGYRRSARPALMPMAFRRPGGAVAPGAALRVRF